MSIPSSNDEHDDQYYEDPQYESALAEQVSTLLSGVLKRIGEIRCLTFAATVDATSLRGSTSPAILVRPDFTVSVASFDKTLEQEVAGGYPTYHGLAVLGFWSVLEAFTEDVCLSCLELEPDLLLEKSLVGKVPLKELVAYAELGEGERRAYLLRQLDRIGPDDPEPSHGKTRLERQLRAFDLPAIKLPKYLGVALAEFYAVRNVLAHRNGRVDRWFVELCPWTKSVEGADLRVTNTKLNYYSSASACYATLLTKAVFDRVREHAPNLGSLAEMLAPGEPFPFCG